VFWSGFDRLSAYIHTLVDTTKPLFFQGLLRRLSVVICTRENMALESFSISFSAFDPKIASAMEANSNDIDPIDRASLEGVLRCFLLKLSTADSYFRPLPNGTPGGLYCLEMTAVDCTFYVMISTESELSTPAQHCVQGDQNAV
jgi:hypothetical protein